MALVFGRHSAVSLPAAFCSVSSDQRFPPLSFFSNFFSVNSTLSDQGVPLTTPVHTPAHDHAAFAPHGSHTMVPQIAVLKSKSRIEEHPHKHTRG